MSAASLSSMHRSACERLGPRPALRFKRFGRYSDLTWTEYRQRADRAAAGLIALGIQPGDRVAILSENRYEWLIADHAILSAGAINVPLHAPLAPKQVEYQIGHSGARGVIVSGLEQAAKIAEVLPALPDLKFLVWFDPLPDVTGLQCVSFAGLQSRGVATGLDGVQAMRELEQALTPQHLATIIYTSGTTGNPKGVMLSHGNLLSNALATQEVSNVTAEDILLSWLPYSHIYARTVDHYMTTHAGLTLCLSASINTLVQNLAEVQPTWLTSVPRFYEKIWDAVATLPQADRERDLRAIFGPRMKQLTSGGAPLPRHVCQGFIDSGMPLVEGYGLTESSPVISFNCIDKYRVGSVGQAIPGVDVRIADDGEILTRGPHVMQGYWKNPEATAEVLVDGWLHTGDVGRLDDDGFLFITDRKKDLIVTSLGKNIAPTELERLLVSDPYIDQAVVYGDRRPFVSAVIVPNFERLKAKAAELNCGCDVQGEFITTPALLAFFAERVENLMKVVGQPERVRKFLLLDRPFQLADDEVTATLKVRRRHIISKFEPQLAALYAS